MAIENITVLKVGTDQAVKNIAELRDNIKALKKELDNTSASFEDNSRVTEELRKNQQALRDAMYGTASSAEDLLVASSDLYDENGKLTGSYNDLVHSMSDLKAAWRATTDEAERAALGEQIAKINASLKVMDASTGNFSRNVGDYTNSFKKALGDMPSYLGAGNKALKDVNATIGAVQKQPLLFLVAGIATIIREITGALKENETAQQSVKKVMAALQPVANFFEKILDKIAGWIGALTDKVLEWAGQSAGAFKNIVTGAVGVGNAVLQYIITPVRVAIEAVKGLGTAMKSVFSGDFKGAAESAKNALSGIGDAIKNGFNFKANFQAGKEAGEAFISGLDGKRKDAKKAAQGLAEDLLKIEADYLKREAELYAEGTEERLKAEKAALKAQYDAEVAAAKKSIKKKEDLARELKILETKYQQDLLKLDADFQSKSLTREADFLAREAAIIRDGSAERLEAEKKAMKARLEAEEAAATASYQTEEDRNRALTILRKQYQEDIAALEREYADRARADELRLYQNRIDASEEGSAQYLAAVVALRQKEYDTLEKLATETDAEYEARRIAARKNLNAALRAVDDAAVEENRLRLENNMAALQENSLAYLDAAVELKQYELDTLHRLEGESNEAFRQRELAAEKELDDAIRARVQGRLALFQSYASGLSGLMSAIADIYEAEGATSEKAAKEIKALRIASATIDTISGAVGAYMQAVATIPPPAGIIIGAVQAATVTAAGIAQILKIKNTDVSRKSSGSAAISSAATAAPVAAPDLGSTMQQTTIVRGASDEQRLNDMAKNQRVVLVTSDLEAEQMRAQKVAVEATF